MYRWEIHCCDMDAGYHAPSPPVPSMEATVFVYAENEDDALTTAQELIKREHYQAVECVEELPEPETVTISVKTGDGSLRTITKPASMALPQEVTEGMPSVDEPA